MYICFRIKKNSNFNTLHTLKLLFLLSLFTLKGYGQQTYLLKGRIMDTNQKPIENAVISISPGHFQFSSDSAGNFHHRMAAGDYTITFRHLSYTGQQINVSLSRDTLFQIELSPITYTLSESAVSGKVTEKKSISGLLGGSIQLNLEALSNLPKFMGTNDPLKILQLMPGVQTSGDANSGIYIRGADPGHNLILWNDAPVYNPSHLLGFFSIFNTGHIGKFTLYKSQIGAEYGGRLSSLISVEAPEDIPAKTSIEGSLGLIASQATLALPLSPRCALYVSGRKTYVGLTLKPVIEASMTNSNKETLFDYEFQDANFTLVAAPTDRDKVILNFFGSYDIFKLQDDSYSLHGKMKWSNLLGSLTWKHQWSDSDGMKLVFFNSNYKNHLQVRESGVSATLPSSIRDFGGRNTYHFTRGRVAIKTGIEYIYHRISPQIPQIENQSSLIANPAVQIYHTHEMSAFLSTDIRLSNRLNLIPGIRYTGNLQTGPYTAYHYNTSGEVQDSTHYPSGKVGFRSGFEPRIALRYRLTDESIIHMSYNFHRQYVNLVSISGVGLPTDFWVPASKNIPAQSSHNFSIGYSCSLTDNLYELSTEAYFRNMSGQAEFNTPLFDLFNQKYIPEESILFGEGRMWGGEFMFKKNKGSFTGWVSYTLGWSRRRFAEINNGRSFPAKHDRRHDLSLTLNYACNKKWDFGTVYVYATGNAFTMPIGIYAIQGNIVKEYGKYNASRMPAYHRLDISVNYWFFKNKNRESGINFSVYNAYKHKNPMYVFVVVKNTSDGSNKVQIKRRYKQLYDIVPSISWTFRF